MKALFFLRYAFNTLLRDGQRTLLAVICVAFGVMSFVSMQLLTDIVRQAVLTDPRATLGGDLQITRPGFSALTQQDIAEIEQMRADGLISAYTTVAVNAAMMIKPVAGGQVYILTESPVGVDPNSYPLVGAIHLSEPNNGALAQAIQDTGDAVITTDLARKLNLKIGDSFTLLGDPQAAPAQLRVAGLADHTPGVRGDSVFYSLATAQQLAGTTQAANEIFLNWRDEAATTAKLEASGWYTLSWHVLQDSNADVAGLFSFMFKGAGILGLFVGGIGVVNTLQVLLARRSIEIATLKTLGFNRRHMLLLFGVETALLGLTGSVVGVILALGISGALMNLVASTGAVLLTWRADPVTLLGGLAIGIATAVIFGLYTIVRASSVRPASLLRDMPIKTTWGTRLASGALLLLMLLIATTITIFVMGSVVDGLGVVGGALVGLAVLSLLFGGFLLLALKIPTARLPLLTMARRNLRSQLTRAIFALIALFMGVYAIGLSGNVVFSAQNRLASRFGVSSGQNLNIYGEKTNIDAVTAQLAVAGISDTTSSLRVPAQVTKTGAANTLASTYVDGRTASSLNANIVVNSGTLQNQNDALLPQYLSEAEYGLKIGDSVTLTTVAGKSADLRVGGFYEPANYLMDEVPTGVIVRQETALPLAADNSAVLYTGHVDDAQLDHVTADLAAKLPQVAVVSAHDIAQARNRGFTSLFAFAAGLASLALVAGAVLIANGVGLAMVQRRREMGILKAVGFSAQRVLGVLLLENALLGLLAGVLGMVAVGISLIVIDVLEPGAKLFLDPVLTPLMILISIAIALLSAGLVAWRPTHVRPLEVLRNE